MTSKRDSQGRLLRADRTYRLRVPADVPVLQFWSLSVYSEDTRSPYDNGGTEVRSASLDSRDPTVQPNPDGSIDLFIGPSAPAGAESNWMKTVDQDGWFVYFGCVPRPRRSSTGAGHYRTSNGSTDLRADVAGSGALLAGERPQWSPLLAMLNV